MIKLNITPDSPMLIGIVGLLISFVLTYYQTINATYGVTLGIFFTILLLSSIFSITPQLPERNRHDRCKRKTDKSS